MCIYQVPRAEYQPLPYVMAFRAKINLFGGLDSHFWTCSS